MKRLYKRTTLTIRCYYQIKHWTLKNKLSALLKMCFGHFVHLIIVIITLLSRLFSNSRYAIVTKFHTYFTLLDIKQPTCGLFNTLWPKIVIVRVVIRNNWDGIIQLRERFYTKILVLKPITYSSYNNWSRAFSQSVVFTKNGL